MNIPVLIDNILKSYLFQYTEKKKKINHIWNLEFLFHFNMRYFL